MRASTQAATARSDAGGGAQQQQRAARQARTARRAGPASPPLEHRILTTVALCLLAFGAVMVYSASSPEEAISGQGYGTSQFVMYIVAAAIGLIGMRFCERHGLGLLSERNVRLLLYVSFLLLLAVLVPGIGRSVNGARRWIAAGPLQFQPSELMKLAIILFLARYIADHPRRVRGPLRQALAPIALVVGPALVLIYAEPDLGTTLVTAAIVLSMLIVGGVPMRYVGTVVAVAAVLIAIVVLASPYQRARLLSFLHPWAASCAQGSCYQAEQGQIAVGAGGLFGRGLGNSLQKIYSLPEAQSDYILGVIGEELGFAGIFVLITLYGMIAFAGLRTARRAARVHHKLLAAGLTALIICQALLNIGVVLGVAPLTGVPLPFISYAPTSLVVMLCAVGLLLGIARPASGTLALVDQPPRRSPKSETEPDRQRQRRVERQRRESPDRDRRNRGPRRPGAGGGGRAAG